jgi:hypothetical protein
VRRVDPLTKRCGSIRELTSIVHPLKVSPTPKEDGGWRTFRSGARDKIGEVDLSARR